MCQTPLITATTECTLKTPAVTGSYNNVTSLTLYTPAPVGTNGVVWAAYFLALTPRHDKVM